METKHTNEIAALPITGYTARITARTYDSTAPDRPGAVDATIYLDGVEVGEVTLVPGHDGQISTWGPGLDHWADDRLSDHIERIGYNGPLGEIGEIDEIVEAVRKADTEDDSDLSDTEE
jgi:hypothetical protein